MGTIDDDPTVLVSNPRARRVLLRVSAVLASLIVLWLVVYAAAVVFVMNAGDFPGSAHMSDFSVFWGAARLGLQGEAAAAFDVVRLNETMDIPDGLARDDYRWMYPPTFHLVVLPLGWLPYSAAWVAFAFGTLALFLVALAPYVRELMLGANTVLLAPVVVWSTLNANANMLTAAVLVLALQALGRGADRRAGLLIAFLAIKPTLALLIPFALAAGGYWRAFAWATFGVAVFVVATVAVFGVDYWVVFFQALSGNLGEAAGGGGIPMSVMVTWLGFGRATGMDAGAAFWIQVIASAALLALTIWAWSRPWLDFRMKAAVLLIAAPLATPYAHYYEMTMTLAGIVLLLSSGVVRHRWTVVLLVAIWVMPILVPVRSPPVIPWLTAPMVTLLIVALATEMARRPAVGALPSRKSA